MVMVLINAGYSVQRATDGHIALQIINAPQNLFIPDVVMPKFRRTSAPRPCR